MGSYCRGKDMHLRIAEEEDNMYIVMISKPELWKRWIETIPNCNGNNITVELVFPTDSSEGQNNNTEYGGTMALLRDELADLSAKPVPPTLEMWQFVDFAFPGFPNPLLIFQRVDHIIASLFVQDILYNFIVQNWPIMLLMMFVSVIVTTFLRLFGTALPEDRAGETWFSAFLAQSGLFLYQSSVRIPLRTCSRILSLLYLFFVIVSVCAIYANIKTDFSFKDIKVPTTLEHIAFDPHVQAFFGDAGYTSALLKDSGHKPYVKFYNKIKNSGNLIQGGLHAVPVIQKYLEKIQSENYLAIAEKLPALLLVDVFCQTYKDTKVLQVEEEVSGFLPYVIPLRRNLDPTIKAFFKNRYTRLLESGIYNHDVNIVVLEKRGHCIIEAKDMATTSEEPTFLQLHTFAFTLYMCVGGWILSACLLLLEVMTCTK